MCILLLLTAWAPAWPHPRPALALMEEGKWVHESLQDCSTETCYFGSKGCCHFAAQAPVRSPKSVEWNMNVMSVEYEIMIHKIMYTN